jgi:hypothetical protein
VDQIKDINMDTWKNMVKYYEINNIDVLNINIENDVDIKPWIRSDIENNSFGFYIHIAQYKNWLSYHIVYNELSQLYDVEFTSNHLGKCLFFLDKDYKFIPNNFASRATYLETNYILYLQETIKLITSMYYWKLI